MPTKASMYSCYLYFVVLNWCPLSPLSSFSTRSMPKQSIFISRPVFVYDHFILAHWSFQTAQDNGTDTEPDQSWLLDPLHLQQESHCGYRVALCHHITLLPWRYTVNYWWGQHLTYSMCLDNVCLQRHDLLGLVMHQCDIDSKAWFHHLLFVPAILALEILFLLCEGCSKSSLYFSRKRFFSASSLLKNSNSRGLFNWAASFDVKTRTWMLSLYSVCSV